MSLKEFNEKIELCNDAVKLRQCILSFYINGQVLDPHMEQYISRADLEELKVITKVLGREGFKSSGEVGRAMIAQL